MPSNTDVDAVLRSLTLEEKISLLAGSSFWTTAAIPAKGVPSVTLTDGPNGTRGVRLDGSTKAACFPAAVSIAASFDRQLAGRIGEALAEEAATKGARCLLAPTVCIQRHPLGGRNFETYSEDPLLCGTMAQHMVAGVQRTGKVAATIKHFVANEQETARTTSDSRVGERALREIYLRPFEMAIKSDSPPMAVMTSYNCLNGTHCDGNSRLLQGILRKEWGWKGLVMSDWGGTNSVGGSLNAGLDLEMPGPPRQRTLERVLAALKAGEVTEAIVNERAHSVLEFAKRVGAWDEDGSHSVERAEDRPEHRKLIREAGARSIVLLKNDNSLLPLKLETININTCLKPTIALIGLAKDALAHGGGSASVRPHYKVSPWEALNEALGDKVNFVYAKGFRRLRLQPPLRNHETPDEDDLNPDNTLPGTVHGLDSKPGFTLQFHDKDGTSTTIHGHPTSSFSPLGTQISVNKIVEIVGDFVPSATGNHCLSCSGMGPTQVFVDDICVYAQAGNSDDPMGALFAANTEEEVRHQFEAGKTYRLRIVTRPPANLASKGLAILEGKSGARLGFLLEQDRDGDEQLIQEAVEVAASADIAIVFTGHDPQWETEGRDQDGFNLPRTQDKLVEAVAAATPRGKTVVVNGTGTPVAMPWLESVGAVLQSWFLGQECGNSVADVLTGVINPEGHLPVSFPKNIDDAPAHGNFGDVLGGIVNYNEGVFVGYRYYDRQPADKVNFCFGHGLSYTAFDIGDMTVTKEGDSVTATVSVTNIGQVYGGVALQLYIGRAEGSTQHLTIPPAPDAHPVKTLVAFEKVRLELGASKDVTLTATVRDFAYFDVGSDEWRVDSGTYKLYCGLSSKDIRQTAEIELGQFTFLKMEI